MSSWMRDTNIMIAACNLNRYLKWDKNRKNTTSVVWGLWPLREDYVWCRLRASSRCTAPLSTDLFQITDHLAAKTTLRSKTACGMTLTIIDDSVQPCFSMSVANGVFARMTGKPERLWCGEDFIWESLLSQRKSARQHKGSKSQPVILGFLLFLS